MLELVLHFSVFIGSKTQNQTLLVLLSLVQQVSQPESIGFDAQSFVGLGSTIASDQLTN
jgi:hypothetical protein